MRKFDRLLGDAVLQGEALRAARALTILKRWDEVVGAKMAERSCPDRYDHGKVFIAVTGSAWAQELRMQKETLLAKLHEMSNDPSLFIDLRFGVRPLRASFGQAVIEDTFENPPEHLSIREIAQRRLEKWRNDSPDQR